jgi:hypothetical protein
MVAGPAVGALTGLATAATGVFAYPGGALSRGVGLDKDDMIQALGLSFTVSTIENLAHAQVAHDLLDAGGGGAVFAASTRLKPPTECAS